MANIKINRLIRLDRVCSQSTVPLHIYRGLDPFLGKVQLDPARNQDTDLN